VKTIDLLFEERTLTIEDVAERARLPVARVEAIVCGRWTPSPEERRRIAGAFGVGVDDIGWGHSMEPRNIRYHRFGLKEDF
jgi:transcriptional regulator with XRE-family HTH domain